MNSNTGYWLVPITLFVALAVGACGGSAITEQSDAGAGGSSAGAGGSGGSSVGGGGSGGNTPECPPLPGCDWCHGESTYDSHGCETGYVCANGVDPCVTDPCFKQSDCEPNEECRDDQLCWPKPACSSAGCAGSAGPDGTETCDCDWTCGDKTYRAECKSSGGTLSCDCYVDGALDSSCGEGSAGGPPDAGTPPSVDPCDDCCGFPKKS